MKIFRIVFFQSIYLIILFCILELVSIKIFPEYSENQIYKKNNDSNFDGYSRITKSKFQYFEDLDNLKVRSNRSGNITEYDKSYNTIWIFGDSVTNGYGLKFTDTFYYSLDKIINFRKKNFNVFATSEYDNNIMSILESIEKNEDRFQKNDFLIFQFNYNDILPAINLKKNKIQIANSEKKKIRNLISFLDPIRFEYLHRSTFIRVLTHYASILVRDTKGECSNRGIGALGQYTYSYGSLSYKKESINAWNIFEERLIKLKNFAEDKNLKFIVLISPISLQLKNHEKLNFHNFDLKCSTIDGRKKIIEMLNINNIIYSDPLILFEETTKIDSNEGNLEYLFFEYDTNHPNPKGNYLISISLFNTISNF